MPLEHWFYTLPLRLRSLFRRQDVERELDEELRYHLERKIDDYISQGVKPEDARYAALRAMDGLEQRKEECRDMRRTNLIDNLLQDVRFGVRMLLKTPGFTAAVVLTLALGIGANTAIFSVVNTVLLRPLPYPDPDRMVQLMVSSPSWAPGRNVSQITAPEFIIWRGENKALQQVTAYDGSSAVNLTGVAEPEQLKALHVSADYFRLFGAPVDMGRTFSAQEDQPGGPKVVIISNGLWHRRFGGNRDILAKTLILGGEPTTVIGILGAGFAPDPPAEIWLPLQVDPVSTSRALNLHAAARLQPGVTLEMAKAQMKPDNERFVRDFFSVGPLRGLVGGFTAEPLRDYVVGDVQVALLVAAAAVGLVLLIACANVANLLLARAMGRTREIAIRAALGGTRLRIVAQLLIESVVLAFAAGALGLPLGYLGLRALMSVNTGNIPRIGSHGSAIMLDWHVLTFTLLASGVTGVIVGLLPALTTAKRELSATLNENNTRTGASVRQMKSRSVLVIAEMALTLALLAGAVLLIRSLSALAAVHPGFDAQNVLTVRMSLNESRFQTTAAVADLIADAEWRVESLPGVIALAAAWRIPLDQTTGDTFVIEGQPDHLYGANFSMVSQHYFEVFRIPLRRGRPFTKRDDSRAPSIVLIDDTLDRGANLLSLTSPLLWRNGNPLGERITMGKGLGPPLEDGTRQIVGVVGAIRAAALGRAPEPNIYVPIGQLTEAMTGLFRSGQLVWAVRVKSNSRSLIEAIQRELRTASGGLPVAEIMPMTQVTAESTAREHFNTMLLSVFAGLALLLAAIGIYGAMAYAVELRTQEIGIRMALGARPGDVSTMVVIEGMTLALVGVGLGVLGTLALTPLMRSLLYGVEPSDPGVIALVAVILSAVALLATYIPARRATLIDPILTLRWE